MFRFLRENWLWILGPIALVLLALALLIRFSDDSRSGFVYPIG
jgi:hypothetical protein